MKPVTVTTWDDTEEFDAFMDDAGHIYMTEDQLGEFFFPCDIRVEGLGGDYSENPPKAIVYQVNGKREEEVLVTLESSPCFYEDETGKLHCVIVYDMSEFELAEKE